MRAPRGRSRALLVSFVGWLPRSARCCGRKLSLACVRVFLLGVGVRRLASQCAFAAAVYVHTGENCSGSRVPLVAFVPGCPCGAYCNRSRSPSLRALAFLLGVLVVLRASSQCGLQPLAGCPFLLAGSSLTSRAGRSVRGQLLASVRPPPGLSFLAFCLFHNNFRPKIFLPSLMLALPRLGFPPVVTPGLAADLPAAFAATWRFAQLASPRKLPWRCPRLACRCRRCCSAVAVAAVPAAAAPPSLPLLPPPPRRCWCRCCRGRRFAGLRCYRCFRLHLACRHLYRLLHPAPPLPVAAACRFPAPPCRCSLTG